MLPNLPRGMAFQIYQAWLQGPHALFRLFEDSFGRQALYGPPDPDLQQREIDASRSRSGDYRRATSGSKPRSANSGGIIFVFSAGTPS
jgi:hypothetical protein